MLNGYPPEYALDVVIGKKRSPLMIAATQTTASLYKCFSGELRKIAYPEM
jgi:CRISPR-associated protein Cas1